MAKEAFKICKRNSNESTHKIRRNGQTPCIIYGEFLKTPIISKIDNSELFKLFKENTPGSIIPLDVDGQIMNCVIKEIQKDNLGKVIHLDFQFVKQNEVIKMKIPVKFIGDQNIEIRNLVFEICNPTLEFHGNVEKIPEEIEFDVSSMNFEDKVFAKDICVPEGVELVTDPDTILAVVNA